MTNRTSKKPRFTRVMKDGKLWLRDREQLRDRKRTELIGPFEALAEAIAYEKDAERTMLRVDGR